MLLGTGAEDIAMFGFDVSLLRYRPVDGAFRGIKVFNGIQLIKKGVKQ